MTPWMYDLLKIFIAGLLVLVNGFFVGAEFALVKIREGRLEEMVKERRPFASTVGWLSAWTHPYRPANWESPWHRWV